jgi:leader peptidase (prepilin peptidase) / N-methyltransferase
MLDNQQLQQLFVFATVAVGASIGSFLNVCAFRIPEGTFWKQTRSVCRSCNHEIPFYYNIPIFSYLMLRGRSACCGSKISIQYPIVEVVTALAFFMVLASHPVFFSKFGTYRFNGAACIRASYDLIFVSVMILAATIDARLFIIPNKITYPMMFLAPLAAIVHPEYSVNQALIGALLGGGGLFLVAWVYYLLRKRRGLGLGDVKLMAVIGGWLGAWAVLPTLALGSILGSVVGITAMLWQRKFSLTLQMPFGPFLALGAFAVMYFGDKVYQIFNFW